MERTYEAWENTIQRQQLELTVLRLADGRQFGLLPLDGAKVRVWDF